MRLMQGCRAVHIDGGTRATVRGPHRVSSCYVSEVGVLVRNRRI